MDEFGFICVLAAVLAVVVILGIQPIEAASVASSALAVEFDARNPGGGGTPDGTLSKAREREDHPLPQARTSIYEFLRIAKSAA